MRDPGQRSGGDDAGGSVNAADAELIAAFIDRRLSGEERHALLERLDREEALYEVFVETVRYRDQAAPEPAEIFEHPAARRRWGRLSAIAALVAAAIATPVVLRNMASASYAETLAGGGVETALGEDWYVHGWSVTHGIGTGAGEAKTAFRLGVRAVDIGVALRTGRTGDTELLTYRMETLLDQIELSEPLQLSYERLRQLVVEGASEAALELAEAAAGLVRETLATAGDAYELGEWAEAGRLAARSGNHKLLRARRYDRTLRRLGRQSWDPEVERQLAGLAELLAASADEREMERLEAAFTTLISHG